MRRPLMTYARWAPAAVFVLGAALRLYGLGEWSLWEDEETTIFFSYHPHRPFPNAFPTFFLILGHLFDYTGCSVLAGRLLSASFGIGSLALTYGIVRRFEEPRVALVALMAISVSPGHLFWSQSIRYYGLALAILLAPASSPSRPSWA
jgi:predicted membrane-bound mannosyltransferase